VERGIDENTRPVEIPLGSGMRQETSKLDVGDRPRCVAYTFEKGIVAGIAACAADHDKSSLWQAPGQLEKYLGPLVVDNIRNP
jgi:hypothetical protein